MRKPTRNNVFIGAKFMVGAFEYEVTSANLDKDGVIFAKSGKNGKSTEFTIDQVLAGMEKYWEFMGIHFDEPKKGAVPHSNIPLVSPYDDPEFRKQVALMYAAKLSTNHADNVIRYTDALISELKK